ncbi:MAG: hypothetical protein ACQEWD_15900 [Bacteroidota bacterium]
MSKKTKTNLIIILGGLQLFNGLSGLLGGFMLIDDPSGDSLSMHPEWLERTVFPNFLIPGIILFLFVGLGNVLGFWLTFKKKNNRSKFGSIFGLILMIWIIAQIAFIGYKDFLQPLYFTSGLFQAIIGIAVVRLTAER